MSEGKYDIGMHMMLINFLYLQARCCMKGLKSMKHVDLCPAPCCRGYHEEVAFPPNLAPVVWCQKDEVHQRHL